MSNRLAGLSLVITRPAHQAHALAQELVALGAKISLCPLLAIEAVSCPLLNEPQRLCDYQTAIFTSRNAVVYTLQALGQQRECLAALKLAAIGSATAQALAQQGLRVMFQPLQSFTSEALLALPAFAALNPQPIVLFKGEGGRTLLADTLTQRGMHINPCIVYKRVPLALNQTIDWARTDYVLITSVESLQQLAVQLPARSLLSTLPLLVGSERMAQSARILGFRCITQADDPSDSAMLKALFTTHSMKQYHD